MKGKVERDKRNDAIFGIALTLIKNIGSVQGRRLLNHFGTAGAIFSASLDHLQEVEGIHAKTPHLILQANTFKMASEQVLYAKNNDIQVLSILDDDYPIHLKNCDDAPLILYYKGKAKLNDSKIISVVGSRSATVYGKSICDQLISFFQNTDVIIVSGLAYGIDISAHQAALANGIPTIGVLAHGLDRVYPVAHTNIANKMCLSGGLLSEFLPGTIANKENFPQRNRIIAGMCDVLVVVEATRKGGALISAELANSYNKDVFAFPGRINDIASSGCNYLIQSNRAGLITSGRDLIDAMDWVDMLKDNKVPTLSEDLLTEHEKLIIHVIKFQERHIDDIMHLTGLSYSDLALSLLSLEMEGHILALPGKIYQMA